MKKFLTALFLTVVFYGAAKAQIKNRFVEFYSQNVAPPSSDPDATTIMFRVFRDTETGQEIVCTEGAINRLNRVDSCFPTGRKW